MAVTRASRSPPRSHSTIQSPTRSICSADFIDVRYYYVLILLAWWREIVLALFFAAGAGALLQWLRGPVYEAAADVVIDSAFGPPAQVKGIDLVTAPGSLVIGQGSEKVAQSAMLLGLVRQSGLAHAVWSRMGDQLDAASAGSLRAKVRADLVTFHDQSFSDLIRITATDSKPEVAVDLATIWAEEYVERVNRLLRAEGQLDAIEQQVAEALQAGAQSQQRLETFLAEDRSAALKRQLAANEQAVKTLWMARNRAIVPTAGGGLQGAGQDAIAVLATIQDIEAESRALAVEIAAAANTLALLTEERDAARGLVQALRDEATKRRFASLSNVRLASIGAVLPQDVSSSPYRMAALAAAASAPVVVVLVLFANLMGVGPFIRRRRSEGR